jgi:hypothetical protein
VPRGYRRKPSLLVSALRREAGRRGAYAAAEAKADETRGEVNRHVKELMAASVPAHHWAQRVARRTGLDVRTVQRHLDARNDFRHSRWGIHGHIFFVWPLVQQLAASGAPRASWPALIAAAWAREYPERAAELTRANVQRVLRKMTLPRAK